MDTLTLFKSIKKKKNNKEIADILFIHKGTVDRWERLNKVPSFYKNDLLRILDLSKHFEIGVNESDQYYTLPETAKKCFDILQKTLKKYNLSNKKYIYVEPSAGCGHFFSLLPKERRIGIDIDPKKSPLTNKLQKKIIKHDFLKWNPKRKDDYIAIGNPPFGRNGKIALDFVKKSFEFADHVAFIVPPIFESTGKGSCRNRLVKQGYTLLESKSLDGASFIYPNGEYISVKTFFQIWSKKRPNNFKEKQNKTCDSFVDIFNICIPYKPSRSPSNISLIGKCDIYLPRTFWRKETAKATNDFYTIPYNDGYGIYIKKNKKEIKKFIKNHAWSDVVFTSTNNSRSLRKDIIKNELIKAGFID